MSLFFKNKSFVRNYITGISIGASLHDQTLSIPSLKCNLSHTTNLRPLHDADTDGFLVSAYREALTGKSIGIIDYGMGNQ